MKRSQIAVIVAHPDDEVLAFGGVMARHASAGDGVHTLILATGLTSRTSTAIAEPESLAHLRAEAAHANEVLGASTIEFGDFPDNRMDTVTLLDVVKRVEAFLESTKASVVYTHHAGDANIDHTVVARAALAACRTLPGARIRQVYAGEVLSSSEYTLPEWRFQPTSYVDICEVLEKKCRAMEAYRGEIREWPHPRSVKAIRALAALRGSEAGLDACEALKLVREVR